MLKSLLVLSILLSGSVFAQNMAESEGYDKAYKEMPDGSSLYVGSCTTHEEYEKKHTVVKNEILKFLTPSTLSESQIKAKIISKLENGLLEATFKIFHVDDIKIGASILTILKNYIDDISVVTLTHKTIKDVDLVRVSMGVGGGNGGYAVFNRVVKGKKVSFKLMSYTFDNDMEYCDKKVWVKKTR